MKNLITTFLLIALSFSQISAQTYIWTQKAALPSSARSGVTGFAIGTKGYIVTGLATGGTALNELWQWNQNTNVWTQKANLPGAARFSATSFKIGTKGYVTTGWSQGGATQLTDLWEYDSGNNTWTQKTNFGGPGRYTASNFVINGLAYVGTGYAPLKNDLWKFDPVANSWTQMANLPSSTRQSATGFAIGNYGYLACGNSGANLNQLWRYEPATNAWLQRAAFPGAARYGLVSFVINNRGIVGTGGNGTVFYQDFYSYNPNNDTWTAVASLPGPGRRHSAYFSLNGRGYVSCGEVTGSYLNDLWEYGPSGISVTITSNDITCNGGGNGSATATASNGTAPYTYVWSNGQTNTTATNLQAGNYVVTASDVNGATGTASVTIHQPAAINVTITGPSEVCKGQSVALTAVASGGATPYSYSWNNGAFSGQNYTTTPSASTTYTVVVIDANGCTSSVSLFVKVNLLPSAIVAASNSGIACSPDSVKLSTNANANLTYQWKFNSANISGANDSVYYAKNSGKYKVIVTNSKGCSKASSNYDVLVQTVTAAISPAGTVNMCQGDSVVLSAIPSSGGYLYKWKRNGNVIFNAEDPTYTAKQAGTYKVVIEDDYTKCSAQSAGTAIVINCREYDNRNTSVTVFPNPTNDKFTISFAGVNNTVYKVVLYNSLGKEVVSYDNLVGLYSFDIEGQPLPAGFYILNLISETENKNIQLIKTE